MKSPLGVVLVILILLLTSASGAEKLQPRTYQHHGYHDANPDGDNVCDLGDTGGCVPDCIPWFTC